MFTSHEGGALVTHHVYRVNHNTPHHTNYEVVSFQLQGKFVSSSVHVTRVYAIT